MFIVRGLRENGDEVFYTGRAGDGWVNADRNEAFDYNIIEGARRKATEFNRMTALHGVRFIAVPKVVCNCTAACYCRTCLSDGLQDGRQWQGLAFVE